MKKNCHTKLTKIIWNLFGQFQVSTYEPLFWLLAFLDRKKINNKFAEEA